MWIPTTIWRSSPYRPTPRGGAGAGVELDAEAPSDQQPVVASGYPAIGSEPSYQVTRGYVSNEHFVLTRAGQVQSYIQHTAPIDSGSSGGPLTSEQGKLLGVNTLKVRGRENVGLAIPASVVASAIQHAEVAVSRGDTPDSAEAARAACESLLVAVAAGEEQLEHVERALGGDYVAEAGWSGLGTLRDERTRALEFFIEDPTGSLIKASALRLNERARGTTKSDLKTCLPASGVSSDQGVAFTVQLGGHPTTWVFGWEQARYKLVHDASNAKPSSFQILQRLGAVQPAKKKWKPSLR